MNCESVKFYSVAEYLELERASDVKHEYCNGQAGEAS
jgi:hypothetical protein